MRPSLNPWCVASVERHSLRVGLSPPSPHLPHQESLFGVKPSKAMFDVLSVVQSGRFTHGNVVDLASEGERLKWRRRGTTSARIPASLYFTRPFLGLQHAARASRC